MNEHYPQKPIAFRDAVSVLAGAFSALILPMLAFTRIERNEKPGRER